MGSLLSDLRYGARMLRRTPLMSALAVLTIGLGIGLTTFAFSTVSAAMVRDLPVPDADRLMLILENDLADGVDRSRVPIHDFLAFREQQTSFEDLAANYQGTVNLAGEEGPPERYDGAFLSANALDVVGVPPMLGRTFQEGEDRPGAAPVLVLGYQVWRNRFAADPNIVGRTLRVNGETATIIGVMPEGFRWPFNQDLWVTNRIDPDATPRRGGFWLDVVGRLRSGVTVEAANEEIAAIARRIAAEYPDSNEGIGAFVMSYQEGFTPDEVSGLLFIMMAAVTGVLLVACANVANLLLARATVREKEVAIRTALGAGRWQVVRQLLAEALVLSVGGGLVGLLLAKVSNDLFNLSIADVERPYWIVLYLDMPTLLFTGAATLVAAAAAGTMPALRASGSQLDHVLRDESRGSSSLRLGRFSTGLVVAELALSCGLMIAAGLLVSTVLELDRMDTGFAVDDIMTSRIGLFASEYPTADDTDRFLHELRERLGALPGVRGAALANPLPATNNITWAVGIEGESYATDADYPLVSGSQVTPGFFETFDIPLLGGRDFEEIEWRVGAEPVAIVSDSFADRYFEGREAVGRRVRIGRSDSENRWMRIVGVVGDIHEGVGFFGDGDVPSAHLWVPLHVFEPRFISLAVRTQGPPASMTGPMREAVAAIDADLPLYWVQTMRQRLDEFRFVYRIFGALFTVFGGAALFMASVGLYGVIAFSVERRRREMGVRMALGADRRAILGLVFRRVLWQLGVGLAIGVGLGYALGGPLASILYGVDPTDPVVYGLILGSLGLTGITAAFFPAFRATRVDPVVALRPE